MTTPDRMPQFAGRNGKFDGGTRTHHVAPQPWIGGLEVPGPACHTGSASFDPEVFQPTDTTVDCLRCINLGLPRTPTPPVDEHQLALDLVDGSPPCGKGCYAPYCICHHPDGCACGCDDDRQDDDEPCPVGCSCAWCNDDAFDAGPRLITVRPDPAYL